MARIIGSRPDMRDLRKKSFYEFAMEELPDYILALFDATFIVGPAGTGPAVMRSE